MSETSPILIWNRAKNREETEQVYGGAAVQWLYGTQFGRLLADTLLSKRTVSQAYGLYQSSRQSAAKVNPFTQEFKIKMEEFEGAPYSSFNDFFIRKFKPGVRPFVTEFKALAAPAEARYLGWEQVLESQKFPVKGSYLSARALLGSERQAEPFMGGPLLIARLCPTDYHRFHFPDDGRILKRYRVEGKLHSVNPAALRYRDEIFATNERQVSLLETTHFGKLAYIEVGALCVGKIIQTFMGADFRRGDEKGYFLFGGSTVIILGEPGRWRPASDLLENTARGREVLVQLGEQIAVG